MSIESNDVMPVLCDGCRSRWTSEPTMVDGQRLCKDCVAELDPYSIPPFVGPTGGISSSTRTPQPRPGSTPTEEPIFTAQDLMRFRASVSSGGFLGTAISLALLNGYAAQRGEIAELRKAAGRYEFLRKHCVGADFAREDYPENPCLIVALPAGSRVSANIDATLDAIIAETSR